MVTDGKKSGRNELPQQQEATSLRLPDIRGGCIALEAGCRNKDFHQGSSVQIAIQIHDRVYPVGSLASSIVVALSAALLFKTALPCKAHSTQSMSRSLKSKPSSTAPSGRARMRAFLTSSCHIFCSLRASWLRPFRALTDLTSWWETTPESAEA